MWLKFATDKVNQFSDGPFNVHFTPENLPFEVTELMGQDLLKATAPVGEEDIQMNVFEVADAPAEKAPEGSTAGGSENRSGGDSIANNSEDSTESSDNTGKRKNR